MMRFNSHGTLHLKSVFHYSGHITSLTREWIGFYDNKTKKDISIRVDSVDHFVPLGVDE